MSTHIVRRSNCRIPLRKNAAVTQTKAIAAGSLKTFLSVGCSLLLLAAFAAVRTQRSDKVFHDGESSHMSRIGSPWGGPMLLMLSRNLHL